MFNPRFSYLAMVVVAGSILPLSAHAQSKVFGIDETMRSTVKLGAVNSTTDDALVDLSKAADVNFIADATQFSKPLANHTDGQATTANLEAQQDAFLNLLLKVAHQRKLTWLRSDDRTFLVWSDPDTTAIAKEIIGTKAASMVPATITPDQLSAELMDYLQKHPNWTQVNEKSKKQVVKISDLPLSLQSHVIAATQAHVLRSDSTRLAASWFTDDLWQRATLGLHSFLVNKEERWALKIGTGWKDKDEQLSTAIDFAFAPAPTRK